MTIHLDPHQDGTLWSQYLEGDLASAERKTLESHLRECEICRTEVKKMRQTVLLLNQLAQSQEIRAPQDFEQKVRRQIRHKRVRQQQQQEFSGSVLGSQSVTTGLIVAVLILLTLILLYVMLQVG